MKTLNCCVPRQSVLDGSEDFVVNISGQTELTEQEAAEFLDSNVLTSGMEELIMQSFDRLSGVRSLANCPKFKPIRTRNRTLACKLT
jgi:hypothetical protein